MDEYLNLLRNALLKTQGEDIIIVRGNPNDDNTIYQGKAVLSKVNYTANYFDIKVQYTDYELIMPWAEVKIGDAVIIGSKTYKIKPFSKDNLFIRCDGGDNMIKVRIGL